MKALILAAAVAVAGGASGPKKPQLRRDPSPVTEGRSGVIASYADVVEPVIKAVVSVRTSKMVREEVNPLLRQFFGNQIQGQEHKEEGLGSGVIVTPDGYILTNNHVVAGADQLTVALSDDRKFTAKVIGTDEKTDVAVIKIDAQDLPSVTLADSDKLRVGDVVFAVGNPLDVGETVTMGIVSAKGRNQLGLLDEVRGYEDFIQTDAAINLGNSGGALVDAKGRLVGINSAILSPSRGNIGIGFAIPVNLAAVIMNSLITTGTVSRGYLGVDSTQTVTPEIAEQFGLPKSTKGVIVTDVTAGGPAEKGGLKDSDVVIAVNGQPVTSVEDMRLRISEFAPQSKVSLSVVRDGKPVTLNVVLGRQDEKPNELMTGVTAEPLTDDERQKLGIDGRISGLLVTGVADDSPYSDRLSQNMVIISINRSQVGDLTAAKRLLQSGRNLFLVYFQGSLSYVSVPVRPVDSGR